MDAQDLRLDATALRYYTTFGYVPFGYRLLGGRRPPFEYDYPTRVTMDEPLGLKELVSDAVATALEPFRQEPVGATLSGGLDTGSVVALARTRRPDLQLHTLCLGFGAEDDEFKEARVIADKFGTEHHELTLGFEDVRREYPRLSALLGRPAINLYGYFAYKALRSYSRCVLTGDYGDEIFGGYVLSTRFAQALKDQETMSKESEMTQAWAYCSMFGAPELAPDFAPLFTFDDYIQNVIKVEWFTKLQYDYGEVIAATAKAAQVEVVMPFADRRLAAAMLPLHWSKKMDFDKGLGKLQLRAAMKDVLPKATFKKPKQGFSLPIEAWAKEVSGEVDELLARPPLRDLVPASKVKGDARQTFQAWCLGEWLKTVQS